MDGCFSFSLFVFLKEPKACGRVEAQKSGCGDGCHGCITLLMCLVPRSSLAMLGNFLHVAICVTQFIPCFLSQVVSASDVPERYWSIDD